MSGRTEAEPRLAYQPALDGLRAFAVVLVLAFHNGQFEPRTGAVRGGFLGVDVFFVLSGYLITTLLLVEQGANGRISLRRFWARRARRLLPAVFIAAVGVLAYAAFVAPAADGSRIRGDILATLLYVQNWHLVLLNTVERTPLNHAWSLSVEEQWYVLWPLLLVGAALVLRGRMNRLVLVIGGLALASAAWTYVLYRSGASHQRLFYGTDTRAQALLVGALLAVVLRYYKPLVARMGRSLEFAGLAGVVVIIWFVKTSNPASNVLYRGGALVFALACAALIAAAVQAESPILRPVLSLRPLCAIGLVSYGLYLYHYPVYFWLTPERLNMSGAAVVGARIVVTAAIATASYVFIEQPIRRASWRRAPSGALAVADAP
jgi:peptidoglycan/LPS O-acetylase OafA/YrhL